MTTTRKYDVVSFAVEVGVAGRGAKQFFFLEVVFNIGLQRLYRAIKIIGKFDFTYGTVNLVQSFQENLVLVIHQTVVN